MPHLPPRRSPVAALVLLVPLFLLLPGCRRAATKPDVVRIGYFANLSHAQAVLGVASGDFARAVAPARLETRVFNAGPSLIEALLAGEVDIGYVGPGPVLFAHERTRGKGLRVVAGAAANGVVVVARDGSGITSLRDLPGKRVATPQLGNTQDIAARHHLRFTLGADDRAVVPIANAEQAGMLVRGEIDAAWVPEPWGERLITEAHARIIAEEKDLWPKNEFALAVVVASTAFLSERREAVGAVLRVHERWTALLEADPSAQVGPLGDALFGLTGKRLPPGTLPRAIARVKFTTDPMPDTMATMAVWGRELGFAKREPDLTDLFDASLVVGAGR